MTKRWETWVLIVSLAVVSGTAKLQKPAPEPTASPTPIVESVDSVAFAPVEKDAQYWLKSARAERERGYGFGDAYKKAYKLDSTLHEAFDGWMLSLVQNGEEHEIAAEMIEAELKSRQGCAACHSNLAWAYSRLDRPQESDQQEKLAFEADPRDPEIAQSYANSVDHKESVRVYRVAIGHNPENLSLRYNLAGEFERNGDLPSALSQLKTLEKLDTEDPSAPISQAADYLVKAERLEEAIQEFTRALRKAQDNRRIHHILLYRGGLYRDLQEYEKAMADYKRAEELDIQSPDSRITLIAEIAVTLDHSQGEQAAFEYLDELCEKEPNNSTLLNVRGSFHQKLGHNKKAKRDYLKAAELLDTGRDFVLYSDFVSQGYKKRAAEL